MSLIYSIVTPSFNQGSFIEETIQSILAQKGDFFIDYIVMDGGSGDNSVEIIKQYESLLAENCKIIELDGLNWYVKENSGFQWNNCKGISYRWYSELDNGQVHALKKGFRLVKGTIYCWLNSDDIYVNNGVLQKVSSYFEVEPDLQLLTADGPFITKEGDEIAFHHVKKLHYKELLYLDYHILQPATFFKKDVYAEENLNEIYTCAFDADFFIHMIYDGVNYKKTDDSFAAFRYYEDNKTIRLAKKKLREQLDLCRKYSHNTFYFLVSYFYRYLEVFLKPRYMKKNNFAMQLFNVLKKLCYLLITGRSGREKS